ncbi:prevent-host-death protein [Kosmotoga arenicorallina S304]|uniref:Antitoxin n=1 Tax=Kosmotoga arenicorallina S304 TaxID=1453497 RepID=A0A176K0T3_9BACT|nr:type II toxin-antitoxin system Phd/YefM family antitoxin [Kosmotoga arenicorallina]OAA30151.1 prevent-host-death protein [Kosmotoga arenicorallina S304]
MKFIPSRELRSNPSKLWKILDDEEIVITSKGKPKAIMIKAGDDVEALLKLIDQSLAQFAVEKMRLSSMKSGKSKLSDKEIEDEISKARREL